MKNWDHDNLHRLVKQCIDVSLKRYTYNSDPNHQFYVPDLAAYNYSIDPRKDFGKDRVRGELILDVLDLLFKVYNIRADYRRHTETFHFTVDLPTVVMTPEQTAVYVDILKARHDDISRT